MKKLLIVAGFALLCTAVKAQVVHNTAQDVKHGTVKAAHATENAAKKVGNETAELASKGASKIADQEYKDKVGPQGQTIYIDGHSRYYWIDEKGHKQYVSKSKLKNK